MSSAKGTCGRQGPRCCKRPGCKHNTHACPPRQYLQFAAMLSRGHVAAVASAASRHWAVWPGSCQELLDGFPALAVLAFLRSLLPSFLSFARRSRRIKPKKQYQKIRTRALDKWRILRASKKTHRQRQNRNTCPETQRRLGCVWPLEETRRLIANCPTTGMPDLRNQGIHYLDGGRATSVGEVAPTQTETRNPDSSSSSESSHDTGSSAEPLDTGRVAPRRLSLMGPRITGVMSPLWTVGLGDHDRADSETDTAIPDDDDDIASLASQSFASLQPSSL